MKNLLLFIILFLISCNQTVENSELAQAGPNDSLKIDVLKPEFETTALPIEVLSELPSPFVLDSIMRIDTTFNYSAFVYFPKGNDANLNESIKQFVEYQISREKPMSKKDGGTSFELWVIDLKVSGNMLYCLFREQSFTEGAAHFNHSYHALNYDLIKNKRILFTDLFKFTKGKSKQSFCNKVNGYVNGIDSTDGYNSGLSPEELTKELNYSIIDDQLKIYPNYCCADEGKIYSVEVKSIKEYIKPPMKSKNCVACDQEPNTQ